MNLKIHRDASCELLEAGRWYLERNPAAAARFSNCVEDVMERVRRAPLRFPKLDSVTRFAVIPGFPYHLVFRIKDIENSVEVLAVPHSRRSPDYWRERL